MALEYMEGFETDSGLLAADGVILANSPTITTSQRHQTISGIGGLRSMQFNNGAQTMRIPVKGGAAPKDICFAIRFETGGGIEVQFRIGPTNPNCTVSFDVDGFVRLYRGNSALLATSGSTLAANTWYWVKIEVTARESASSGRLRVFLNGSTSAMVDTGLGVDCRAQTTDDFDSVFFDATNNVNLWIDDYHQFGIGTAPDQQLYCSLKRPTAEHGTPDGVPSTGTDNAATVDEDPASTADYNELTVAGADDRFTMGALGFSPLEVLGVRTVVMGTAEGSITSVRGIAESNGTTATGTLQALSTGGAYSVVGDLFLLDPDGDIPWTGASVDAAAFGYEVG